MFPRLFRVLPAIALALLVAACGGGGGGSPPPPAPPPPSPPPPGPTDPTVALARPISAALLCGNGQARRAAAVSSNSFVSAGASLGIDHSHSVADAVWQQTPASIERVMRTGAVVATDLNTDCWPDLVFASGATTSGQLVAYDNAAGTGFDQRLLDLTSATTPVAGLGAADLDGDYRPDLVTGNLLVGNAETFRANASGSFTLLQSISMLRPTFGFAFADYSDDAWIDVHAAHWISTVGTSVNAAALLRNLGEGATPRGSLTAADAAAGTTHPTVDQNFNSASGFVDLDGDGHRDLLISSDWATTEVLRNTGAATYTGVGAPVLYEDNAGGQAIRDFDNDGRWDWFVAYVHAPGDSRPWPWGLGGNKLNFGIVDWPYFAAATLGTGIEDAEWPGGVCAEDFNNDGFVDLFVENGFGYAPDAVMTAQSGNTFVQQINQSLFDKKFLRARLYINQGNRTFVEESQAWGLTALTNGRGVACLDYDRDGDVDIGVAQNSGPALLYENRHAAADGDSFLEVRLVSPSPNTRALGAVVRVTAGGQTQMRQASANGTYQGQDGPDLHFGLGGALAVDSLVVTWPDGSTTDYGAVPVNRFLTLLDPEMLPYPSPMLPTRLDVAISAALAHVDDPAQQDNDLMITLTWLERLHGITLPYSPADEMLARIQTATNGGNAFLAQQLRSWRRLFDPLYQLAPADYAALTGIDAMTLAAVHCHQFPLDDADMLSWSGFENQGGYGTTHVLLALLWAIDNDCAMPASYSSALLDETIADVYAIASTGGTALTDLRLEAMTFLAAAGRHDLIQAAWVDLVLNAQQPNGGWLAAPGEFATTDHTTVLGLWLLLQLAEERKVLTGYVAQPWDP